MAYHIGFMLDLEAQAVQVSSFGAFPFVPPSAAPLASLIMILDVAT